MLELKTTILTNKYLQIIIFVSWSETFVHALTIHFLLLTH